MDNISTQMLFIILGILILASAYFSGSETGMMSLNRYRLRHLEKEKHKGAKRVSKLLERPDRLIGLILIGIGGLWGCQPEPTARSEEANTVNEEVQVKLPKNIVFLIGDGMGLTQITAGLIAQRDALNLEKCPVIGLSKTNSASSKSSTTNL